MAVRDWEDDDVNYEFKLDVLSIYNESMTFRLVSAARVDREKPKGLNVDSHMQSVLL